MSELLYQMCAIIINSRFVDVFNPLFEGHFCSYVWLVRTHYSRLVCNQDQFMMACVWYLTYLRHHNSFFNTNLSWIQLQNNKIFGELYYELYLGSLELKPKQVNFKNSKSRCLNTSQLWKNSCTYRFPSTGPEIRQSSI